MITGVVTVHREAVITLALRRPDGGEEAFEAVIDTGFNRFLTLPPALVARWQLSWVGRNPVFLADGSTSECHLYEAEVLWDGRWIRVEIEAVDTAPLVGMALLAGFDLHMSIRPNGPVTIEAISE